MNNPTYKCQANITSADGKITYRQGEMINHETYEKLPERLKNKFKKLNDNSQYLSDADVRRLLLELREKVEVLESKLLNSKTK